MYVSILVVIRDASGMVTAITVGFPSSRFLKLCFKMIVFGSFFMLGLFGMANFSSTPRRGEGFTAISVSEGKFHKEENIYFLANFIEFRWIWFKVLRDLRLLEGASVVPGGRSYYPRASLDPLISGFVEEAGGDLAGRNLHRHFYSNSEAF